jgi:DNA-binding transcriptional LysR family regulator
MVPACGHDESEKRLFSGVCSAGAVSTNLLKREADLALRAGVRPTQRSLVVRKIARHSFHRYASEAYRKARPRACRAA